MFNSRMYAFDFNINEVYIYVFIYRRTILI